MRHIKKRWAHVIRKNRKMEMPRNVIFFDTETRERKIGGGEVEAVFDLGEAIFYDFARGKKIYLGFENKKYFWNFVERSFYLKNRLYIVAHNIAFDMRVLGGFEILKSRGYTLSKFITGGTMNIWEFKKLGKTIVCLDNMNFFKSSLAKLGESVGLEKMEMPKDSRSAMKVYCRRDVEIMVKAWEMYFKFLKENNLGNFGLTIAAQAMNAYRHKFMKSEIFVHTNNAVTQMERASYHGGRTECFKIGKLPPENYFMLDVNSMYPAVMRKYDYPNKLIGIEKNFYHTNFNFNKYCYTAECLISAKEPIFAVKEKNKLIFPVGIFEATLTTREIEKALNSGSLLEVKRIAIYEKINLFREYVEYFYNVRLNYKKENNIQFAYLCKLFLNSLYGKFGQRNESFEIMETTPDGSLKSFLDAQKDGVFKIGGDNPATYRKINNVIWKSSGLREGFDSFCAIAAHITADARFELWNYFKIANRKNVFYCDTDSILTNTAGYNNLKKYIGDEMGKLSLKNKSRHVEIYGAKDYIFGKEITLKGIRKDAKKIGENEYRQVKFEGLKGALRKGRLNKMIISSVDKKLKRVYNKGVVAVDGKVAPHSLKYQNKIL